MESVSPMWADLQKVPLQDQSTMYDQYVQVPINGNLADLDNQSTITFQHSDTANWYHWSRAYVQGRVKLTKDDGTDIADQAALINGYWNLFRRAELRYGGQPLHVPNKENCGLIATVPAMAEYSEDYIKAGGSLAGYYPDVADGGTTTVIATPAVGVAIDPTVINSGFKARLAQSAASKEIAFILPLREVFGFLRHTNFALRGEQMELSLDRQTNYKKIIHGVANSTHKVKFTSLALWVPQVKPSVIVGLGLDKSINDGFSTTVQYKDWRAYTLGNGTKTDIEWNPVDIYRPSKLVFTMQLATALTNNTINGGIFDNGGLERFYCRLGGQQYPARQFEPKFTGTNADYSREYHDFLEAFGKHDPMLGIDHGSIINYERFGTLYPFMCIDLQHRSAATDDSNVQYRLDIVGRVNAVDKLLIALVETDEAFTMVAEGGRIKLIPSLPSS